MASRYLSIILLFFFSSSLCCDDGTLYLFTQKSTVLEVSITNGSLSSNSFSTNCYPNFGSSSATLNPDEEKIYLSCSEGSSYIPSIATITDDKVSSTLHYKTDCLVGTISYDPNTGYLWGSYLKSYVDSGEVNGWYELNVVALDPTQSEGGLENHFKFVLYNYTSTGPSPNNTCAMFANGQYSFIDTEKSFLYAISAPFIAQIDISTKTPVLVKRWRIENKTENFDGYAYSPKDRVLYAVNSTAPYSGNTLVAISIDDWSLETVTNFPFFFGTYSSAVMDNSSRYYITFNPEYNGNYVLATYDTEENTTTSFDVKTNEDIRNIVSAGCPSKSKDNKIEKWIEDHKKAIIIGCSIGGGLIVVGVAAILIVRWRRRRHYHPINNYY